MPDTFPTSTLNLSSLQPTETPSLLDIRPWLNFIARDTKSDDLVAVLESIQAAFDNIQETLRSTSPSLDYMEIDAADIGRLFVGSAFGPGQFAVFNGPPDYSPIGWIGTADSGNPLTVTSVVAGLVTVSTAIALTSVSKATTCVVTTAAPHNHATGDSVLIAGGTGDWAGLNGTRAITVTGTDTFTVAVNTGAYAGTFAGTISASHGLKPGDGVLIDSTSNAAHNGWFVVATTPSITTFTCVGLTGSSTGGTSTKQFQGGWLKTLAVAGTSFDTAKLIADVDGSLTIKNALILLRGSGATIELDPTTGAITVVQSSVTPARVVKIYDGQIDLYWSDGSNGEASLTQGRLALASDQAHGYGDILELGLESWRASTADALSRIVKLHGYTGNTEFGPTLALHQARGNGPSGTATQSGDRLGGVSFFGTYVDGGGAAVEETGAPTASIRAEATENHATNNRGAKVVIAVTPNVATAPVDALTVDENGIAITGVLKIDGTQVVKEQQSDPGNVAGSPTVAATTITGTFGATYTSTEQGYGNSLLTQHNQAISDIAALKTQVDNLITDRNNLRTLLKAHGLMA